MLYRLSLQCSIGSVSIPPAISWTMRLTGCARGSQPQGNVCKPCAAEAYADGGAGICRPCPRAGVACSSGLLTALPGFYRPPAHAGRPLDAASELHACPFPERCLVNDSIASAGVSADEAAQLLTADVDANNTGGRRLFAVVDSSRLAQRQRTLQVSNSSSLSNAELVDGRGSALPAHQGPCARGATTRSSTRWSAPSACPAPQLASTSWPSPP